jgi:hypothetical protein
VTSPHVDPHDEPQAHRDAPPDALPNDDASGRDVLGSVPPSADLGDSAPLDPTLTAPIDLGSATPLDPTLTGPVDPFDASSVDPFGAAPADPFGASRWGPPPGVLGTPPAYPPPAYPPTAYAPPAYPASGYPPPAAYSGPTALPGMVPAYPAPAYPAVGDVPGGYPPGYQTPIYPAAPMYPPYSSPAVRGTNALAIVSLVMFFVFWPAAVICGHIALSQIRRTGEGGRGLAVAALVLSYGFLAFIVLAIGLLVAV